MTEPALSTSIEQPALAKAEVSQAETNTADLELRGNAAWQRVFSGTIKYVRSNIVKIDRKDYPAVVNQAAVRADLPAPFKGKSQNVFWNLETPTTAETAIRTIIRRETVSGILAHWRERIDDFSQTKPEPWQLAPLRQSYELLIRSYLWQHHNSSVSFLLRWRLEYGEKGLIKSTPRKDKKSPFEDTTLRGQSREKAFITYREVQDLAFELGASEHSRLKKDFPKQSADFETRWKHPILSQIRSCAEEELVVRRYWPRTLAQVRLIIETSDVNFIVEELEVGKDKGITSLEAQELCAGFYIEWSKLETGLKARTPPISPQAWAMIESYKSAWEADYLRQTEKEPGPKIWEKREQALVSGHQAFGRDEFALACGEACTQMNLKHALLYKKNLSSTAFGDLAMLVTDSWEEFQSLINAKREELLQKDLHKESKEPNFKKIERQLWGLDDKFDNDQTQTVASLENMGIQRARAACVRWLSEHYQGKALDGTESNFLQFLSKKFAATKVLLGQPSELIQLEPPNQDAEQRQIPWHRKVDREEYILGLFPDAEARKYMPAFRPSAAPVPDLSAAEVPANDTAAPEVPDASSAESPGDQPKGAGSAKKPKGPKSPPAPEPDIPPPLPDSAETPASGTSSATNAESSILITTLPQAPALTTPMLIRPVLRDVCIEFTRPTAPSFYFSAHDNQRIVRPLQVQIEVEPPSEEFFRALIKIHPIIQSGQIRGNPPRGILAFEALKAARDLPLSLEDSIHLLMGVAQIQQKFVLEEEAKVRLRKHCGDLADSLRTGIAPRRVFENIVSEYQSWRAPAKGTKFGGYVAATNVFDAEIVGQMLIMLSPSSSHLINQYYPK